MPDALDPKNLRMNSLWWRDFRAIGLSHDNMSNWIRGNISCKLGDGKFFIFLESFLAWTYTLKKIVSELVPTCN